MCVGRVTTSGRQLTRGGNPWEQQAEQQAAAAVRNAFPRRCALLDRYNPGWPRDVDLVYNLLAQAGETELIGSIFEGYEVTDSEGEDSDISTV